MSRPLSLDVEPWGLWAIHCSLSNYQRTGDAIQETDAEFFRERGAVFVRFVGGKHA